MTEVNLIHFIEHSSSPGMIKIIQGHLLLILASKNEERCKLKLFQGHLGESPARDTLCKEAGNSLRFMLHGLRVDRQHEPELYKRMDLSSFLNGEIM